jgi:hypothetical protein
LPRLLTILDIFISELTVNPVTEHSEMSAKDVPCAKIVPLTIFPTHAKNWNYEEIE